MRRKCIICGKIFGESGDRANGSITGGICEDCEKLLDSYYYCRRQYKKTGNDHWLRNSQNFWRKLKAREKKNEHS